MLGHFKKDKSWEEFPPVFVPVPVVLLKDIPTGWEDDVYEAGTQMNVERMPHGRLYIVVGTTCINSNAKEGIDFKYLKKN